MTFPKWFNSRQNVCSELILYNRPYLDWVEAYQSLFFSKEIYKKIPLEKVC